MGVTTPHTGSLRVPGPRQSSQGQSGPKPRLSWRRRWTAGAIFLHRDGWAKRGRGRVGESAYWIEAAVLRRGASWQTRKPHTPRETPSAREGAVVIERPGRQEKPLAGYNHHRPYRKPSLVGSGKYRQVDERTSVKELGKLTPYLR